MPRCAEVAAQLAAEHLADAALLVLPPVGRRYAVTHALRGEQAVLSPEWSIHSAAATHNYTFIWGMGGENLDYGDQDFSQIVDLR